MRNAILIALFSAIVLALSPFAGAAEFNDGQRKEMETIVKDYLLSHPEILQEMSQTLEEKQKQAEDEQRKSGLAKNAGQIFHDKSDLVAGNPDGTVTMVEFFDYNCAWCKKGFPEVLSLLESDKDLRFVLKEFPIFGEDSEYAARAAIASGRQGKYWELHKAMFGHEGKITKESVDEIAAGIGINMGQLKKDMDDPAIAQILVRNRELAQTLAINGTPAFIIDDKLVPGYLPKTELATAIGEIRAKGGCSLC